MSKAVVLALALVAFCPAFASAQGFALTYDCTVATTGTFSYGWGHFHDVPPSYESVGVEDHYDTMGPFQLSSPAGVDGACAVDSGLPQAARLQTSGSWHVYGSSPSEGCLLFDLVGSGAYPWYQHPEAEAVLTTPAGDITIRYRATSQVGGLAVSGYAYSSTHWWSVSGEIAVASAEHEPDERGWGYPGTAQDLLDHSPALPCATEVDAAAFNLVLL